jgi:hypothetical protein
VGATKIPYTILVRKPFGKHPLGGLRTWEDYKMPIMEEGIKEGKWMELAPYSVMGFNVKYGFPDSAPLVLFLFFQDPSLYYTLISS